MNVFDNILQSKPYISVRCTPNMIREKLDIIKPIYNTIKYDIDCYYSQLKFIIQIIRDSCIDIDLNRDAFKCPRDKIIIEELIEFGVSLLYMSKSQDIDDSDAMLENIYDTLN
jgi:hypothetical protein